MGEDLDFDGGALADGFNLIPAQLPGEHRPGEAQIGGHLHPVQVVEGHLGGGVDGQIGDDLAEHPQHAQILNEHRVGADGAGLGGHLRRLRQLPVGEQGVEGQVDLRPPQVAIRNRRRKLLLREIFRVAAGVKVPVPQIDGVGAVLNSRRHGLHGPGGGEQFQHRRNPPWRGPPPP